MSDRNNSCPRCGNQFWYDGHLDWCNAIQELEERLENLENLILSDKEPIPDIEEKAGTLGGGEDASYHEWNFGHPYRGSIKECWTCRDKEK